MNEWMKRPIRWPIPYRYAARGLWRRCSSCGRGREFWRTLAPPIAVSCCSSLSAVRGVCDSASATSGAPTTRAGPKTHPPTATPLTPPPPPPPPPRLPRAAEVATGKRSYSTIRSSTKYFMAATRIATCSTQHFTILTSWPRKRRMWGQAAVVVAVSYSLDDEATTKGGIGTRVTKNRRFLSKGQSRKGSTSHGS